MAYAPFHIPLMVLFPLDGISIAKEVSDKRDIIREVDRNETMGYTFKKQGGMHMEPMFYTVTDINGDYAQLMGDQGHEHSITMFLLPEGTTVGSRLKLENFIWTLEE